ncbi:hypothetical protein [Spirochaeta isovalerica]|uniref:Uncharacterized protein n=1 Tax=Spirochaeta isovalerica TaxID=150 RepID=A0A841RF88_9SPIO|nr:hypothetical protein [Spirochaeta isovalerica]MBB6482051.1 hypothetical protein [Spirochaeta isovalerica]
MNENTKNFGNLFSSINFFADLYGRLDHLLIGALPLTLEFSRSLKDFGDNSFLFVFKDHILYPDQFPLGYQPDSDKVETWMTRGRRLFSSFFLTGEIPSPDVLRRELEALGAQLDFADLISYRTFQTDELENILLDFRSAGKFLESENGIIVFE